MPRKIRPEVSERNPYHIPRCRQLELTWFCRQYKAWKKEYAECIVVYSAGSIEIAKPSNKSISDSVGDAGIRAASLKHRLEIIEEAARECDEALGKYIFKGVTEEKSFVELKMLYDLPCEKDLYYKTYRKFFYILDKLRD